MLSEKFQKLNDQAEPSFEKSFLSHLSIEISYTERNDSKNKIRFFQELGKPQFQFEKGTFFLCYRAGQKLDPKFW